MEDEQGDRRLVARCIAGEEAAWRELFDRHAALVRNRIARAFLRRSGRSARPEEAEEVFQETCWRLSRDNAATLRRFGWQSRLSTYIASVAVFATLDRIRSDAAESSARAALARLSESLGGDGGGGGEDAATGAAQRERIASVRAAVEQLSGRERLIVEGHFFQEIPLVSIAASLGISKGYASRILAEALERLREKMSREL